MYIYLYTYRYKNILIRIYMYVHIYVYESWPPGRHYAYMCWMTHSCVWIKTECDTWHIHTCVMTRWCVDIYMCDLIYVWHDAFTCVCVDGLMIICVCNVTSSYVWFVTLMIICVTWCVHMCNSWRLVRGHTCVTRWCVDVWSMTRWCVDVCSMTRWCIDVYVCYDALMCRSF